MKDGERFDCGSKCYNYELQGIPLARRDQFRRWGYRSVSMVGKGLPGDLILGNLFEALRLRRTTKGMGFD